MSPDARDLIDALAYVGHARKLDELAMALWGLEDSTRRVQVALREARLAGEPIVSGPDGIRLETDPDRVAACAASLRRRGVKTILASRAMRKTAAAMRQPATLWEGIAR